MKGEGVLEKGGDERRTGCVSCQSINGRVALLVSGAANKECIH